MTKPVTQRRLIRYKITLIRCDRAHVTKVLAVRRGDVVENGESSRSSSEVDPSLNWHNIEIGSMFAACCKTGEIGSPLLVHFPESVLLIPRREQGVGL